MKKYQLLFLLLFPIMAFSQDFSEKRIADKVAEIEKQVIEWRHHFHQFPELSNREINTSKKIEELLKGMGLEVKRGMAKTGVVAVLDSGKPGPTIGLRADIDGLPVKERAPLSYASKEKGIYIGEEVPVMHACGHDTHIAMLLGAAKILTGIKKELTGKIVFVFQPAEEGAPPGEEGGARLMIKEGLFDEYGIDVFFGQHIDSGLDVGTTTYKVGGSLAAADKFEIFVDGKQTHGSRPWGGVDPIVISAQIIMGLQTIISRQTELTKEAAVITVGKIESGVRNNIIPESAYMVGTIRTLDTDMQDLIHEKIKKTAELIAEAGGAKARVIITKGVPVTHNDIALTRKMIPSLYNGAGEENVRVVAARTGAEDFSFYAQVVPSLFWFTGGKALDDDTPYPHHTPDFQIDDSGLKTGVKTMLHLTLDYMSSPQTKMD